MNILTLEELKGYMRIDYDDEDSILNSFLIAAHSYIDSSITDFYEKCSKSPSFKEKAKICIFAKADMLNKQRNEEPINDTLLKCLIMQLDLEK